MIKFKSLAAIIIIILVMIPFTACTGGSGGNSEVSTEPSSEVSSVESSEQSDVLEKPEETDKTNVRLAVLKGPTGIGAVNLIDKGNGGEALNKYDVTVAGAPDEITSQIIAGEIDIAAVPTNLASVLYNKTEGKVQMLSVNTLGVIYVMSTDPTVDSIESLKGRTIVSAGQGTVAEYALNHILTQNGLDLSSDVTVDYKTEHSEVASLFIAGEAEVVVLPEPFVTQALLQRSEGASVIDLTEAWKAIDGNSELTMGCIIVRKEFAESNPQAVKDFMTEYKESIDAANSDVSTTSELCERYDIIKAAVAEKAIPRCNMVFIDSSQDLQTVVTGFLQVLFDANPESIGKNMPGEDFFYINE